MKKWLLVLGMITCMFGLTACGQTEETTYLSDEKAFSFAQSMIETINQGVVADAEDSVIATFEQIGIDGKVISAAFDSLESATADMGSYVEYVEVVSNTMEVDENGYVTEGVITSKVKGSMRDATVEIVVEDGVPSSITVNVIYSFGETMEKAALNTVLGMGTVFAVLILISVIISCFGFIPKIQAMFTKKSVKEDVKAEAVDNTIAQIIEKEELSDDLELVAVISAAIAASEGVASTDGFVVRSIKRAGNKWSRA